MSVPTQASRPVGGLVALLGAIMAFGPLAIDMYLPAMPALRAEFLVSAAAVQQTLSAYLMGLAVGQLIYGPVTDRFGRRRPLIFGIALFSLASVGCALAQSIEALVALRVLQALGGAAGMVVVRAVVRDLFALQEAARVFSLLILIMGVAPILAPALGGQVLLWLDWRWIFAFLALFGALCLAAVLRILPETLAADAMALRRAEPLRAVWSDYMTVLRNRSFLVYALTGASGLAAVFSYIASAPFVMIELLGVSPAAFGIWFGVNAGAFVLGSHVNSRLLRRFGPVSVLPWTVGGFLAACLLLLGLTLGAALGLMSFVGATAMIFFAVGSTLANTTALALHPFAERAGAASAMLGTLQLGSGALAGLVVGLSHDDSALPLALVMTVCAVLGNLSLHWLSKGEGSRSFIA